MRRKYHETQITQLLETQNAQTSGADRKNNVNGIRRSKRYVLFCHFSLRVWLEAVSQKEEHATDSIQGGTVMLDIIFIALVIVFFGIAFWYVRFCERV